MRGDEPRERRGRRKKRVVQSGHRESWFWKFGEGNSGSVGHQQGTRTLHDEAGEKLNHSCDCLARIKKAQGEKGYTTQMGTRKHTGGALIYGSQIVWPNGKMRRNVHYAAQCHSKKVMRSEWEGGDNHIHKGCETDCRDRKGENMLATIPGYHQKQLREKRRTGLSMEQAKKGQRGPTTKTAF